MKKKKKVYCYFNGKYKTLDKIVIKPQDLGILRSYGVFDFMVAFNGKPFLWEDHWKRLKNSAAELNLKLPVTKKEYYEIITKLLKMNKKEEAVIRSVLTGGVSSNGFCPEGKETFYILIEKKKSLPSKLFKDGAKVALHEFQRQYPHAKTTNYVESIKFCKEREKKGQVEVVYTSNGKVLEASTANVFIVKNGELITAKENILHGITRNLVIDLSKKAGYKVEQREVEIKELLKADEVFLTASNKDVLPIVKIDDNVVGDGNVGPITQHLMELFADYVKNF